MLFQDALKELLAGNFVSRTKYDTTGEYYVILPGMLFIWKIMTQPNPAAGNWMPLVDDLIADDWKVVSTIEAKVEENLSHAA